MAIAFNVQKAIDHRLILLSGDEEALRRRALNAILQACGVVADDFDLETTRGGDRPLQEWLGVVSTTPFLADKRILVVRNVLRADPEPCIHASAIPPTGLLILVSDEETGSEDKQNKMAKNRAAWEKLIGQSGGYVEVFKVDPKVFASEIKATLKQEGKSISERAIETLQEMTGGSLSRALEEIEKLVIFVGDRPGIQEADVSDVVVASREWNVFKLADAAVMGRVGEALRQVRILVGKSPRPEEAIFRSILPQMSRQFRLIWQARICLDQRTSLAQASPQTLAMFPSRNNLAKEKDWTKTRAINLARKLSFSQIASAMQVVADADARIKGMLPYFTPHETLERMVLEIAEIANPVARR